MAYVDGFIVPVPKSKLAEYEAMSRKAGAIWKELGALSFCECRADDVKPGEVDLVPQAVELKDDEIVFFSWITYKSRADRDAINDQVMKDPRLEEFMDPSKVPFDGKRMIIGGFEMMVDL